MTQAPAIHVGTRLVEVDFSGLEAVLVGWFARDPIYIRIAKLGMHAYVASHMIHRPADLTWPDLEISAYFAEVKGSHPEQYNRCKRTVHGTGYGMTPQGMVLMFPKDFPTLKDAQHTQKIYFSCAPGVPKWQAAIRQRAHDQGFLGGPPKFGYTVLTDENAHPYGYRHDFYGVIAYRPVPPGRAATLTRQHVPMAQMNGRDYQVVYGEDSKSAMAFYPQSTGSGILKEAMIPLFADHDHPSYIGEAYFGRTPLRAPIHDSLLLEAPPRKLDRILEAVYAEMLRPVEEMPLPPEWNMGTHLVIGVEGKIGINWEDMKKIKDPPTGIPAVYSEAVLDKTYFPATDQEEEDVQDLRVEYLAV